MSHRLLQNDFNVETSLAMQQETMHTTLHHAGECRVVNEKEYRYGKLWKKKLGNTKQHTYNYLKHH